MIGWLGSADGYCGIQQDKDEKRVAIYSLWNNGQGTVQCEDQGEGVVVSNFVEDGTGLRSMRDLDWNLGETITFTIKGEKDDGNLWKFSCWFQRSGKDLELMARYSMPCQTCPLNPHAGFYSFVEDWNRDQLYEGYKLERRAIFNQQQMTLNKTKVTIEEADFSRVETGFDAFAADRAKGEKKVYWILSTGGDPKESSPQQ